MWDTEWSPPKNESTKECPLLRLLISSWKSELVQWEVKRNETCKDEEGRNKTVCWWHICPCRNTSQINIFMGIVNIRVPLYVYILIRYYLSFSTCMIIGNVIRSNDTFFFQFKHAITSLIIWNFCCYLGFQFLASILHLKKIL